jgi:hypothetical protein
MKSEDTFLFYINKKLNFTKLYVAGNKYPYIFDYLGHLLAYPVQIKDLFDNYEQLNSTKLNIESGENIYETKIKTNNIFNRLKNLLIMHEREFNIDISKNKNNNIFVDEIKNSRGKIILSNINNVGNKNGSRKYN